MLLSASNFTFFGFQPYTERFFPVQGGVFHIVMAVAYALAARSHGQNNALISFIVAAKLMATVFLLSYFVFVDPIWMLLLSASGDGALGLAILIAYNSAKKQPGDFGDGEKRQL